MRSARRADMSAELWCIDVLHSTRLRSRALLYAQESSAAFGKGHSRACHFGGVFSSSVDKQIRVQCRTSGLRVPAWIRTSVMQRTRVGAPARRLPRRGMVPAERHPRIYASHGGRLAYFRASSARVTAPLRS